MIQIEVINHVDCQVIGTAADRKIVRGLLGFQGEHFYQGQYAMKRKSYTKSMMLKNGVFPTGLLPRLRASLDHQGINYNMCDPEAEEQMYLHPDGDGVVEGIELREDQVRLVKAAIEAQRGIILSPPGTGKTMLILHILAYFPTAKVIILVHNQTILTQTIRELGRFPQFKKPCQVGAGKTRLYGKLAVATRQSMVVRGKKEDEDTPPAVREEHLDWLIDTDAVIIDECHLFGDEWGQYATILRSTDAPVRIGFTATKPPEGSHSAMALEGMVGPVIEEVTMEEGREKGLLVMPKIELVPINTNKEIAFLKQYQQVYRAGIVENRARNRLIISKAKAMNAEGKSVIVFVNQVDHGRELIRVADLLGLEAVFVWQKTKAEDREDIKDDIQEGRLLCAISSQVWREGLNIPTLGGVILAGGGKAELSTMQAIGRSLRRAPGKDTATIIDFLDPYRFLAEHTVERINIYMQQGWL